jgi:uncharacterized protein with HEPN domain
MLPDERDAALLWEMRRAAGDALDIAAGLTLETLRENKWSRYALPKAIEVIGEAASRVSKEFRDAHPEIAWREMTGMRNRIVHDYWRVDFEIVWEVIQEGLEPLLARLSDLLPPSPPSGVEP